MRLRVCWQLGSLLGACALLYAGSTDCYLAVDKAPPRMQRITGAQPSGSCALDPLYGCMLDTLPGAAYSAARQPLGGQSTTSRAGGPQLP